MPEQGTDIGARALDLMLRAGSGWVLWLLIALSLAAVAVMIERAWFFAQERPPVEALARAVATLRAQGAADALRALDGARSMEAAVARACLAHIGDGAAAMEEHVAAILETERLRYERGLAFLGTLGNNAPFIGLFGTVLGIVRAFHDLAADIALGSQAVMAGIAEALVATGVGLMVALPAVAMFNLLTRRVESAEASAGAVGHQILAFVKAERPGRGAEGAG